MSDFIKFETARDVNKYVAQLEAQLESAITSMREYHAAWQGLEAIMVEAGMDAKSTPEQARAWLRERLLDE